MGRLNRESSDEHDPVDLLFCVGAPVILGSIAFGPELMSLFGQRFIEFAGMFAVLAFTAYMHMALGLPELYLRMRGGHGIEAKLVLSGSAISLALDLVLIPTYGGWGATLGAVIGALVVKTLATRRAARLDVYRTPASRLVRLLPAVAVIATVLVESAAVQTPRFFNASTCCTVPVASSTAASIITMCTERRLPRSEAAGQASAPGDSPS